MTSSPPTTVAEALQRASRFLQTTDCPAPEHAAETLLQVWFEDRTSFVMHLRDQLPYGCWEKLQKQLERLAKGEPLQYVTGVQTFYGYTFQVNPSVLIPRPETELLVHLVLNHHDRDRPLRVIDVGTGSGAIAVTLALEAPGWDIWAADISLEALNTAKGNAAAHHLKRIHWVHGDLLNTPGLAGRIFDVVISNPPYIPVGQIPSLQRQVRDFEPRLALAGGQSGMEVYRRLIPQAHAALAGNGRIYLEIGWDQAASVGKLLDENGFTAIEVVKDLNQHDRVMTARKQV
jgi:release factor glutamine methyltransferase